MSDLGDIETRPVKRDQSDFQAERKEKHSWHHLETLAEEAHVDVRKLRNAVQSLQAQRLLGNRSAFRSAFTIEAIVAAALVLGWATLAHVYRANQDVAMYFTLVAPAPLAMLVGLLLGRPRTAFAVGFVACIALLPTLHQYIYDLNPVKIEVTQEQIGVAYIRSEDGRIHVFDNGRLTFNILALVVYGSFGALFCGFMAYLGAKARDRLSLEEGGLKSLSRQELIRLVVVCQDRLGEHRQHAAFVSVDVVGSTKLRQGVPELESEHAFSNFRRFIEARVRQHDGQVQMSAGDGIMAMFFEDRLAVRFAREVLESLNEFNVKHNRLGRPFSIRVGASAGEVAIDRDLSLGQLQSPIIDRAAWLQKHAPTNSMLLGAELQLAADEELADTSPWPENESEGFIWSPIAA
jgi:class 3 adenylate cyclase